MSIQQNFPEITPSLSLNFARSKTLDPRVTFTRTSSATRVNETGLVEVVPANEPRFDHEYDPVSGTVRSLGLLVEEARTNLITYSEDFSTGWGFNRLSYSENQITSPDGNVTADKLIEDTTENATHRVQSTSITFTSGIPYTHSVFAKSGERSYLAVELHFQNSGNVWGASAPRAWFDLATGTIGDENNCTATITNFGNGWYRCSITQTASSTGVNAPGYKLATGTTGGDEVYTGDGTSGIYIWGAQVEAGAFPTSYIPTAGSTVTRTADNVSMVGENFSSWYNPSEGTVYADTNINGVIVPSFNRLWSFTNSNFNLDGLGFFSSNSSTSDGRYGISGEINGVSIYSPNNITTEISVFDTPRMKSCFGFVEGGNCNISFNGVLPNTNGVTATDFPNVDRFLIGQPQRYQGHSCMTISQLTYYPRRLTNSQLQALTK